MGEQTESENLGVSEREVDYMFEDLLLPWKIM